MADVTKRLTFGSCPGERNASRGAGRLVLIARHTLLEAARRIARRDIEEGKCAAVLAARQGAELERTRNSLRLNAAGLAHMSHDTRNAVTAISANLDMLEADIREGRLVVSGGPGQLQESLHLIREGTRQIIRIISSAYALAEAETGEVRMEKACVDLSEETMHIAYHLIPLATKKGIWLRTFGDQKAFACIDQTLFRRVLANLITNAIKFTQNGGVLVAVAGGREAVSVKVCDTGIGIRQDDLGKIFVEGGRGEGTERYDGRGLGLYIAKTYTEMMGGTIGVDSELGKGSTFTVTFPAAENGKKP